jgi:hypothetical protein
MLEHVVTVDTPHSDKVADVYPPPLINAAMYALGDSVDNDGHVYLGYAPAVIVSVSCVKEYPM